MPRAYRMGERATKLEATRRRIVDAAKSSTSKRGPHGRDSTFGPQSLSGPGPAAWEGPGL